MFINGCAKRIPISYDKLEKGHYIYVETISGESLNGNLVDKDKNILVINKGNTIKPERISRSDIVYIKCKPPVYDENKNLISEQEISSEKMNKNLWLFMIGGGALSFGTSFFLTANILHNTSDETGGVALWAPTIGGTLLGTAFFANNGSKADRRHAIERIKDKRKEEVVKEIANTKKKRKMLNKELQELKRERKQQNKKIRKMLKKIDKKKE